MLWARRGHAFPNGQSAGNGSGTGGGTYAVTGRTTRPLWSPSAGYRDARVRAIAANLGYRPILWTVDSADWTLEATPESVYSHVMNGATNGAIVVLHFDSPTTRNSTAEVLPALIDNLRGAGYRLVTITELLTSDATGTLYSSFG